MNNATDAIAHLTPANWAAANRLLVRKALAEFSHERLLTPSPLGAGRFALTSDDGAVEYRFTATIGRLDHWRIDADSITRYRAGSELPLDAVELIIELREALTLTDRVLPTYLDEITSTLAGAAFKRSRPERSATELACADFQTIEREMTEGHPCFVANNGRIGFDIDAYRAFAPEAGQPVRLVWVAARRDRATFSSCADLGYVGLVNGELGSATLARFRAVLAEQGFDLDDFLLIPVHPWQWSNRLAVTFAGELAKQHLVYLGTGDDEYQAQQSIRTFFNTSAPGRHYVKTALSVLNMGFLRGLSAEYMRDTPAINDWVADLIASDPVLAGTGVAVLRERAAIGYHHDQFAAVCSKGSPYLKMLAALWRESPIPLLVPGERLATMACLLHVDKAGNPLVSALIRGSRLAPRDWLRRYFDAYLVPLLHCYYRYSLIFMPHGENIILVLDEAGVPVRVILKDISEEVAVITDDLPLPPSVERIRARVPAELKILSIFTDIFDCFFRFLAAELDASGTLTEDEFWATVAERVFAYQESRPELAGRFADDDLFAEEFALSCLNRLQLRDNQQMVDLQDPAGALQIAGTLRNPLASYKKNTLRNSVPVGASAAQTRTV